jgi:CHASE2 domain-containing sensor protein
MGLDYFLEEDSGLFFGRDAERRRIIGNLRASRLTLLYAESGVGKSSLLHAGVSARLSELAARSVAIGGSARYFPVVVSTWGGDSKAGSIAALEAAVSALPREHADLSLRRDSLENAIEDAAAAAGATPLLILDQFEEHFLYEPDDDGAFDDELARCVNRPDLRANFLISLREDAYPLLGQRYKALIPNVYANYLHLDFLGESAARDAIVEPVKVFNRRSSRDAPRFDVEPALVDAVVEQVRRGRVTIGDDGARDLGRSGPARVETAYLQLVMKRVWEEEVAAGSARLRLETLEQLGGANTIVRGHLDDVLAQLPEVQRDAAAAAFRFLVTSGGRKIALTAGELSEFSGTDTAQLEPALDHLEHERILRPVPSSEAEGAGRREIYHDVLAPAVLDWRQRHVDERERATAARELASARQRARRLEVRNRRLAAAVIWLAAVAIALALYLRDPEPVQRLELQTVDARFSVRGEQAPDPGLVLITVDDQTLKRFPGEDPGSLRRVHYARILRRLSKDRPAVIAVDASFTSAKDRRGDRALIRAIHDTGSRLVLGFLEFRLVQDGQAVRPKLFGRPFKATGVRFGDLSAPTDVDGHTRRADYQVPIGGGSQPLRMPTLSFAAADAARGGALRPEKAASRRAWRRQTEATTWIDFSGPAGTVPRVSARDVLTGEVAPGKFTDKYIVIGLTASEISDAGRTPFDLMRGVEIQANALDTMLHGAPLRDPPGYVDVLAIVLLGAMPPLALLAQRRGLGVVVAVGTFALYLAIAQIAFNAGWVVAVVAPLVAFLVAALGAAGMNAARMFTRRRGRRAVPSSGSVNQSSV